MRSTIILAVFLPCAALAWPADAVTAADLVAGETVPAAVVIRLQDGRELVGSWDKTGRSFALVGVKVALPLDRRDVVSEEPATEAQLAAAAPKPRERAEAKPMVGDPAIAAAVKDYRLAMDAYRTARIMAGKARNDMQESVRKYLLTADLSPIVVTITSDGGESAAYKHAVRLNRWMKEQAHTSADSWSPDWKMIDAYASAKGIGWLSDVVASVRDSESGGVSGLPSGPSRAGGPPMPPKPR